MHISAQLAAEADTSHDPQYSAHVIKEYFRFSAGSEAIQCPTHGEVRGRLLWQCGPGLRGCTSWELLRPSSKSTNINVQGAASLS